MRDARREQEFTDFVASRQVHLRRIAYAVCGDWHRADDLLQTALTKLYVAWPRVRRDGREEAYVRRIIVRADIDEHRRPWRREQSGLDGHDAPARAGLPVEERSALFDALQALPVRQRISIVLRDYEDLTEAQTAEAMGCAVGTVKSQVSAGIARLRDVLGDDDPDLLPLATTGATR